MEHVELMRMADDGCPHVPEEPDPAADAILSTCGKYRYTLSRQWDTTKAYMVFVMLNPSTADASVDDPTIRRCIGFAKREGCGGIVVVNLYARRATDPATLWRGDPIGPDNDMTLRTMARGVAQDNSPVVFAWGSHGIASHKKRDRTAAAMFIAAGCHPQCLGTTKDGSPRHPLYLAGDTPLVPWVTPWAVPS